MHAAHPFGRGRLVAAIVVSLSLHALVLVGWLHGRTTGPAAGSEFGVQVDGPDDDLPAFTLLEPRAEAKPPTEKPPTTPSIAEPLRLPAEVQHPTTTAINPASHSGPSPQPAGSLPKFGGATPFHGKVKAGKTIVYILDRSASMGPDDLLGRAIASLNASLAQLGPDGRFQIVAYNGGTALFSREPVLATPANVVRAGEWLQELTAEGRSDHRAGFREALACRPNAVFLLTDADDLEESDVRGIRLMMRAPVYLQAVVFGTHQQVTGTPLERLTAELGGHVEYVPASQKR
jgi:von Willebrand factor type A domain